jgi:hypothetical protein
MPTTNTNTPSTNFDGIHVSKGFVRGLQGQVLKLEQVQQSLIQQLEHANKLATDNHTTAVMYQQSYDQAIHKQDEMKQALERETLLRISREHELEHFKNLLQEQLAISSNSRSPSPDHAHRKSEYHYPNEPMSPVSIPSSPRKSSTATPAPLATLSAHDREYIKWQLFIDQDTTPFDENNERIVVRDGKRFKQWVQYGFENTPWYGEREMTMSENDDDNDSDNENENDTETKREFQTRYFYESSASESDYNCDPICHSDTDSD